MGQLDAWAGVEKWPLPSKARRSALSRDPSLPQGRLCQRIMIMAKDGAAGTSPREGEWKGCDWRTRW